MLQLGDDAGFALKPFRERGVVQELLGQDFQGDVAVQLGLVCLVDGGHTAPAEERDDAEWPEGGTGCECHAPVWNEGVLVAPMHPKCTLNNKGPTDRVD